VNVSIYIWWVSIFKSVGIIFADSCILLLGSDGWFDVILNYISFFFFFFLFLCFCFGSFDNLGLDLNF